MSYQLLPMSLTLTKLALLHTPQSLASGPLFMLFLLPGIALISQLKFSLQSPLGSHGLSEAD